MSTIRRMQKSVYRDAEIHTPYGATECLPVSSISASQMDDKLIDRIESGDGVCVGPADRAEQGAHHQDQRDGLQRPLGNHRNAVWHGRGNHRVRPQLHRQLLAARRRHANCPRSATSRATPGTAWATSASSMAWAGCGTAVAYRNASRPARKRCSPTSARPYSISTPTWPARRLSASAPRGRQVPVLCIEVNGKALAGGHRARAFRPAATGTGACHHQEHPHCLVPPGFSGRHPSQLEDWPRRTGGVGRKENAELNADTGYRWRRISRQLRLPPTVRSRSPGYRLSTF